MNRLYYGDCFPIMQEMPCDSVDLIYLDPPFNSNRDYNAVYKDETGCPLPDQIEAFCDLWTLDADRERVIGELPLLMHSAGIEDEVTQFCQLWMNALRKTQPRLLAYLSYMAQRLLPMRRLLKPTGSLYLHCAPSASHYLKLMMDGIFGYQNFRNEIIWSYRTGGVSKKWFARKHDVILFYTKCSGRGHVFNVLKERSYSTNSPPGFKEIEKYQDVSGNWYTMATIRDVWEINALGRSSGERLGYATQKPLALVERIIQASSNEGDVVLDPFCGCATTLEAAHRLRRRWIGIDISIHTIKRVAKVRLSDRLGLVEGKDFSIEGVPRTLEGARDLWERDKYHFQKWAIEQVDGFVTSRKSGDRGIDGRLYFSLPNKPVLQSMVLEVKGGKNVSLGSVRELCGVLERDDALMAGLIVMEDLSDRKTRNFRQEMTAAGVLQVSGNLYPRIQMLSVKDIFNGKRFNTPSIARARGEQNPILPLG